MRRSESFAALALLAVALALPAVLSDPQADGFNPTRVLVFYDRTAEAHFLWSYRFRVLVVEDLVGSGGRCWKTLENGTTVMDRSVCRPVSNTRVRIQYAELREWAEVVTDSDGVAETSWRIFTYPRVTFVVRLETSQGDVVERQFIVESRPWTLAAVVSFSSMLSSMVYVLRRGVW
jgi:hypothetical protein